MTIDHYVAAVDTGIFVLLIVWAFMDRMQFYFRKSKDQ
jgi:hypothetical protein